MKLSPVSKQVLSLPVFHMSGEKDYFYEHPITVILGFFGAVACVLCLMFAIWIGHRIW